MTKTAEVVCQIDGYVWCDARGEIHSEQSGTWGKSTYHDQEFFDLYLDGTLCSKLDHRSVYAVVSVDEKDGFGQQLSR